MILRQHTPDLKAPEKLLLAVLSDFGDHKGGNIHPSLKTLSERSSMSRRSVINNLNSLEEKGYIAKIKGGVFEGQNVTNKYFINMEKFGFKYDGRGNIA